MNGKEKGGSERACADCNRERVRFGLHVGADGDSGGAHAWRRDRAGEYPDGGSLRERIGGVPWKSSCGEGVFAAAASDDACKHGCISSVAAAREPAVCGRSADGRIGGLFAAHWRGNPGGAARQPKAEDEAQTMMQENLQTAKG